MLIFSLNARLESEHSLYYERIFLVIWLLDSTVYLRINYETVQNDTHFLVHYRVWTGFLQQQTED
jgi:hypothetical protein